MPGPVFQNVSPSPSFAIDPATPIMFDVVDTDASLTLVVPIIIIDPNVAGELVHDWTLSQFAAAYAANSSRLVIANGFRYTFRRLNGWTSPPSLRVWAVDSAGNIGVL